MLLADARRETGNLGCHHLHAGLERSFQVNKALVKFSLLLAGELGIMAPTHTVAFVAEGCLSPAMVCSWAELRVL